MLTFIRDQQRRPSEGLRFKALMGFCNCDPQGKTDPSKPAKCSYRTLMNYKKELMSGKLLNKKIDPESGRPLYYVTKKGCEEVEKQRIKLEVDSLAEKWITPLHNLLIKMKKENPNVDLDRYCFTFIGDIPTVFHKSVENMESHIAFERNIRERHRRDLSTVQKKYDEEYYTAFKRGDKAGIARVEAKIEDEVGWRVSSYFRKLLKKAEKEDIVGRLMILYGLTEEMLKEMGYS